MIDAALPGFLWAGAAFAIVPLALHFLTRRPPARRPLPTARFLTEDPRTELRLRRRPVDLLLLALRMAFALLLGAAFAELTWERRPAEDVHVVLLDAGADSAGSWQATLTEVARVADGRPDVRVLAYGAEGGDRLVDPGSLGAVDRGPARTRLDDGLRALRRSAMRERWASVEATWVARPTWDQWQPGLAFRREALWPGSISLPSNPGASTNPAGASGLGGSADPGGPADPAGPARGGSSAAPLVAVVLHGDGPDGDVLDGVDPRLIRALHALGAVVPETPVGETGSDSADWAFTGGSLDEAIQIHDPFLRRGGTLFLSRATAPDPDDAARVIAVADDATPLAHARTRGGGCVVSVAGTWSEVADARGPDFPDFIAGLAADCRGELPEIPLDAGARSVLSRSDLPERVSAAQLGGTGPRLTPWILAILGLLLGVEFVLTSDRGRGRGGSRPVAGGEART